MSAVPAGLPARRPRGVRVPGRAAGRLLLLELRHNAMLWLLPAAAAVFWFTTYRRVVALPPLWNVRAMTMQAGALEDFVPLVTGGAAWMGARESRRGIAGLVAGTARPRWGRQLACWAATACWAEVAYLGCVGVLYAVTAHQASWGGPLWWPVMVGAASLLAFCALGFVVGALIPGRLTAPVAAIAAFVGLGFTTEPIQGSHSPWRISPVVTGGWPSGPNDAVGTFYHYLPDLPIAQVMFMAGLALAFGGALGLPAGSGGRWLRGCAAVLTAAGVAAAGTAVALAGTGRLDRHGMIDIPALHDAASDQPIRYTPVCRHGAIPICVNPAYTFYLPAVSAALGPVLREVAGLPGAPVSVRQAAVEFHQGTGSNIEVTPPPLRAGQRVFRVALPVQFLGPAMTFREYTAALRSGAGADILDAVTGVSSGGSPAQWAVLLALLKAAGISPATSAPPGMPGPGAPGQGAPGQGAPGSRGAPGRGVTSSLARSIRAAAQRFAAFPAADRHVWLARHLMALRAGRISLPQLP